MTMRILLIFVFCFAGLTTRAQAEIKYGSTGLYEIVFNDYGACIATRVMRLETSDTGGGSLIGSFAFGAVTFRGEIFGLLAIFDPDIKMTVGQSATGIVSIDGSKQDAYFLAEDENLFSAYTSLSVTKKIAFGQELRVEAPAVSYNMPLTGTLKAWAALQECIQEQLLNPAAAKLNPLGEPAQPRKLNPFGANR